MYEKVDTISNRLKYAIEVLDKKQSEIVRSSGIDKGALSHYIKGTYKPKEDAISKLAKTLNISEKWLQGYDCPMKEYGYGKILIAARKQRNLSIEDLCEMTGISLSEMQMHENNLIKTNNETLEVIATSYGISVGDLVWGTEIPSTAERLSNLRENTGMSISELSSLTGIDADSLTKYESGELSLTSNQDLAALASGLQSSPAYIKGFEEEEKLADALASITLAMFDDDELRNTIEDIVEIRKNDPDSFNIISDLARKLNKK